jgi:hypothetical protein
MQGYNFSQFESDLDSWLKKGRFVWYVSGNISPETAIKIAEDGISQFGLAPLSKLEIDPV